MTQSGQLTFFWNRDERSIPLERGEMSFGIDFADDMTRGD
jgi:hypothetical protein